MEGECAEGVGNSTRQKPLQEIAFVLAVKARFAEGRRSVRIHSLNKQNLNPLQNPF